MPPELSERPEELIRQFLTDNIRPAEIEGYDPTTTNTDASDFLPITNSWSRFGDHYPVIVTRETNGPTVPNSGETNFQSVGQNGPNQFVVYNVTVSCQAVESRDVDVPVYRNQTRSAELVKELYDECRTQVQQNAADGVSEATFIGMTPATQTRSSEERDSGSTLEFVQRQGTVSMGVLNTP